MATLSPSSEDYLKTIWSISEWSGEEVAPTELARRMGLSPSTVTEAVKKLAAQGLVQHRRYGPIQLSALGRSAALQVVRKHRLIETFLHNQLGYAWEELHAEAEALEHAVSDRFMEAIDTCLGHPLRDPHGDPIPRADGSMPPLNLYLLNELDPALVTIEQVDDDDNEVLVFLGERDIRPGAQVRIVTQIHGLGLTTIEFAGEKIDIPTPVARRIRVSKGNE